MELLGTRSKSRFSKLLIASSTSAMPGRSSSSTAWVGPTQGSCSTVTGPPRAADTDARMHKHSDRVTPKVLRVSSMTTVEQVVEIDRRPTRGSQ